MLFNNSISGKQKTSFDLLWQNSNPETAFNPQSLNLPTGYSAFAVEFKYGVGTTFNDNALLYVSFSTSQRYFDPFVTKQASWESRYGRYINSATDGNISFGRGYKGYTSSEPTTNNSYAIPVAIYGLKFTV